jgi:hypothetical protein
MTSEIILFMGKRLDDMTREELIEAVKILGRQVEGLHSAFRSYADLQRLVRRAA